MKAATLVAIVLLAVSAVVAAQNVGVVRQVQIGQAAASVYRVPAVAPACPVSMRAQQRWGGDLVAADKDRDARPKGIAQRLELIVTNPDSKRITRARVTVHGLAPKGRVTQLASGERSDVVRTFDVNFSAGTGKDVTAGLRVPGMAAVFSIDLDSVTYADGSTWRLADGQSCRTVPDPMMLISGR